MQSTAERDVIACAPWIGFVFSGSHCPQCRATCKRPPPDVLESHSQSARIRTSVQTVDKPCCAAQPLLLSLRDVSVDQALKPSRLAPPPDPINAQRTGRPQPEGRKATHERRRLRREPEVFVFCWCCLGGRWVLCRFGDRCRQLIGGHCRLSDRGRQLVGQRVVRRLLTIHLQKKAMAVVLGL